MISLRPITDANREAVEALGVRPDQRRFVSSVRASMVEAEEEPDAGALCGAVCADETPAELEAAHAVSASSGPRS